MTTERLGPNKEYIVRRFDPETFTFNEALDSATLFLNSFDKEDFWHYVLPPSLEYRADEDRLYEAEPHDASKRMNLYVARHEMYKEVSIALAQLFFHRVINDHTFISYGLYTTNKDNKEPAKLIGFCDFFYPAHMLDELAQMVRPNTLSGWGWFKWTLYQKWVSYQTTFYNWYFKLRHGDHPLLNPRLIDWATTQEADFRKTFPKEPERLDRLSQLNYDKLRDERYEHEDTVYIQDFYIHSDYWGRKLGQMFFRYTIDSTPNINTPFVSKDKKHTSYGPQKLSLNASDPGQYLYRKLGFFTILEEPNKMKDGHTVIIHRRMHLIRE